MGIKRFKGQRHHDVYCCLIDVKKDGSGGTGGYVCLFPDVLLEKTKKKAL